MGAAGADATVSVRRGHIKKPLCRRIAVVRRCGSNDIAKHPRAPLCGPLLFSPWLLPRPLEQAAGPVMDGLDMEDISPALEVTEDFLHCLEGAPVDDGRQCKLQEVSALGRLGSSGLWGMLAADQLEVSPCNVAWAGQPAPFSILGLRQGKRSRARSTNDLAAHTKDDNSSAGPFKRGHNRSRSDANYKTYMDNGVLAVDKNMLKNMVVLSDKRQGADAIARDRTRFGAMERSGRQWFGVLWRHSAKQLIETFRRSLGRWAGFGDKESSSSRVKQGELELREGSSGRWTACHVELTPCELRIYGLDSSGNRQLCTAYSLSHCQSVGAPLAPDGCVLQAIFFNSTRLQLRAPCQWEALEWRRCLWEHVLAARPAQQQGDLPNSASVTSPGPTPGPLLRPTALPIFTQRCPDVLKSGLLYQRTDQNNWRAFTFVLSKTQLQAFPTEGRGPVSEPVLRYALSGCLAVQRDDSEGSRARFQAVFDLEVLRLQAETERKAQDWVEVLRTAAAAQRASGDGPAPVQLRSKHTRERRHRDAQRGKRQSVTTSFLGILSCLAVEKGLTAQSFRCAGCQRPVGLSRGKAKVCCYSGWYYCTSCHEDDLFLIPARLLHNWDTSKHKVSKQAKEFLEFVYEEPLLDVQQLNPCLYEHCEALAAVLRLRQQLQSLRAYLFSCRAAVAEDLRRRIFPREYLLQHIHLYSLADLQQGAVEDVGGCGMLSARSCSAVQPRLTSLAAASRHSSWRLAHASVDNSTNELNFGPTVIDGKLAPFLSKVIKFASSHVYSCSLCSEKGFICEMCHNGQVIYPFQESATKRCESCGAVFHTECRMRAQPCPRCVRRELHKKPSSFWRRLEPQDSPCDDPYSCFELPFQDT
ncbi:pleckstrin-like domain-containing family M member 3-like [Scleropages formosus]|uniref:Pleckstrin-like domain-containing family M member 3-like n=1 Tax=Scleropages formosus TaxID=113540 RepID=A0A0P7WLH5_SCLFO|nr:pleckstrin-like domain-containing family M member 3-like [Scleropages formosus]